MNITLLVSLIINLNTFDGNWNFPFTFSLLLSVIPLYFSICDVLYSPSWKITIIYTIQQTLKSINSVWLEKHLIKTRSMLDNVKYSEWDVSPLSIFITGCDEDGFIKKNYMKSQDIGELYININNMIFDDEKIDKIYNIDNKIDKIIEYKKIYEDEENKNINIDHSNSNILFIYGYYYFIKIEDDLYIVDKKNNRNVYFHINNEDIEFLEKPIKIVKNYPNYFHYGNIHMLNKKEKMLYYLYIKIKSKKFIKFKQLKKYIQNGETIGVIEEYEIESKYISYWSLAILFSILYSPIFLIKYVYMLITIPLHLYLNYEELKKIMKEKNFGKKINIFKLLKTDKFQDMINIHKAEIFRNPKNDPYNPFEGYYWVS